jgi:hypothetical protein
MFFSPYDWYKYMYKDVAKIDNVVYISTAASLLHGKAENTLYRIAMGKRANQIVKMPFKKKWFQLLLSRIQFSQKRPFCFIWHYNFLNEIKNGMADYIRDAYPDAKNVFYFTDIKNIDSEVLAFLRTKMDMIGVFDPQIAQKWELDYWPNVYPTVEHTSDGDNRYDLCFMGSDRGRKDILEKVAQKCKQHHIRTAFYIVSDEENPELDNIHYLKTPLAYEKVVELMSRTNCILELRVEPYNSSSVRVQEAVVYDKKLLTDNPNSTTMPGCVEGENVLCFDSVEEIDWNFVTARKNTANHYQGEYSLQTSLEIIEQKLNER